MESSHIEKTPNHMEDVFKMLLVSKRVFDILPTRKVQQCDRKTWQGFVKENVYETDERELNKLTKLLII